MCSFHVVQRSSYLKDLYIVAANDLWVVFVAVLILACILKGFCFVKPSVVQGIFMSQLLNILLRCLLCNSWKLFDFHFATLNAKCSSAVVVHKQCSLYTRHTLLYENESQGFFRDSSLL